jgi:two-component system chemotaxis response regulator CheY
MPSNKTILIVDDSATIVMSLKNNLEIAGYNVESADNGKVALDKIQSGLTPNLIITDINMPVMTGLEFIKHARKPSNCRFTPILILTTESSAERKTEAKSLGATGWLVKPCSGTDLINVVKKVLP